MNSGGGRVIGRFLEEAIERAGLGSVRESRRRGDLDAVRTVIEKLGEDALDLLTLGAVADAVRAEENGDVVRIHPHGAQDDATREAQEAVTWIRECTNELDLLRKVAIARVTGPSGCCVGVDWGRHGLELAQVALGFGATDLIGPITTKAGLVIHEDDKKKVKGLGMVATSALKRREIAALVQNAGRQCEFTDEADGDADARANAGTTPRASEEAAHA